MTKQRPRLPPHPWPGRLRAARLTRNLTEQEVAARAGAGISEQLIKRMEAGDGQVEVATFLQICSALGAHPADMLDREVDPDKIWQREVEQGRIRHERDQRGAEQ